LDNVIKNNNAIIIGKISSGLEFSHEVYGEGFYVFYVDVARLSNSCDSLPVTISERLLLNVDLSIGRRIKVEGQFRSYNNYKTDGNRLILTIFAREFEFIEEEESVENPNQVYLDGFICKKPVYRTTPFGREITDLLIAVNRPYNKSDYIPCIAWGRNAKYSQNLIVGDNIRIWGRVQSRPYQKKLEDGEILNKTAYEISVSKMEIVKKDDSGETEDSYVENNEDATINNENSTFSETENEVATTLE
jgi:single-stranded DNA-binding protein